MAKPTITRERLEQLADNNTICKVSWDERIELAQIALAAMDSEPVAEVVSIYGDPEAFGEREIRPLVGIQQMPYGTKLYRHAQPAPVVSTDLFHTAASAIEDLLTTKDRTGACVWFDLPFRLRSAANAQPVPVVPDAYVRDERGRMILNGVCEPKIGFSTGWNACRAAMLQASNSPAQSDCCPAQNHVSPEQNGDTPAQSQGWIPLSEQMPPSRHEVLVGRWWGEKPRWCCKWATYIPSHPDAQSSGWLIPGASWTPTHWMPLPAAPRRR